MLSDDVCGGTLKIHYLDDYGESHYIGPIEGAQPMSEAWVNGFDHQGSPEFRSSHVCGTLTQDALKGWLDLQQYYISAFKSGVYPSVLRDRVFLWARLYPADADVPQDHIGKPSGWQHVRPSAILSLRIRSHGLSARPKTSFGLSSFRPAGTSPSR